MADNRKVLKLDTLSCPRCGGNKVNINSLVGDEGYDVWLEYECEDCRADGPTLQWWQNDTDID